MMDCLGRKQLEVLWKYGAEAVIERGKASLAGILNCMNNDDGNSFGAETTGNSTLLKEGWVKGVEEGRGDEENVSSHV
jgi:hypothetical protein